MNWILFGFKGSGKSYYAKRLGLPYLDTDFLIEERVGPIVSFVQQEGIDAFREVEKIVIASLHVDGHVIAVGGGAPLDAGNLAHLEALGRMIYLDCPKEILHDRFIRSTTTFLPEDFAHLYSQRIPLYETIPAERIELTDKTSQQILEELWQVIDLDRSSVSPPGASLTAKPLASSSTDVPQAFC